MGPIRLARQNFKLRHYPAPTARPQTPPRAYPLPARFRYNQGLVLSEWCHGSRPPPDWPRAAHLFKSPGLRRHRWWPRGRPNLRRPHAAAADAAWFWSIIVIGARHAGIKTDGRAATFYDAKAQFQDNYRKWLAWAKLEEPIKLSRQPAGGTPFIGR